MKKIYLSIAFVIVIMFCVIISGFLKNKTTEDYFRFHIRANSNSSFDQYVKYDVKDKIIALFSPILDNIDTFSETKKLFESSRGLIESYANSILLKHGCKYRAKVSIGENYFEEKHGEGFVMSAGVYESIVVCLGSAEGNNWWGLVYPSLSYVPIGNVVDYDDIVYKSKIVELYNNLK